jgi:hypothetical protein
VVGEGDVVKNEAVVVGIERAPAAVAALHAHEPRHATTQRALFPRGVEPLHARQRHHHHGRVVEVGIEIVVVLERPAARRHLRTLDLPVARHRHLPVDHPLAGAG